MATIALALVHVVLAWWWTDAPAPAEPAPPSRNARVGMATAAAIAAAALLIVACRTWLHQIFATAIDPFRADMLVVVREGLRRIGQGLNPYVIYHVPWAAPLTYGPLLWGPYTIPMALHADLRFLGVVGELFVPVACAAAVIASAWRGRMTVAAAALIMLGAIAFNGELKGFHGDRPHTGLLAAARAVRVARRP